jgi:hypothetical protein
MINEVLEEKRQLINDVSAISKVYITTDLGTYQIKGINQDLECNCFKDDKFFSRTFLLSNVDIDRIILENNLKMDVNCIHCGDIASYIDTNCNNQLICEECKNSLCEQCIEVDCLKCYKPFKRS